MSSFRGRLRTLVVIVLALNLLGCAYLRVRSVPAGAQVWVDNRPTPHFTPAKISLPMGEHTVTVKLPGYEDPPSQYVRRKVEMGYIAARAGTDE